MVGSGVVFSAEELGVVEVGVFSVGPVDDVVGVASWCWCVASLPYASFVSLVEGAT